MIICEKPKIEIICGDCLEELKKIQDGSVDLVLTDPPYELDNHGGGNTEFAQRKLVKDLHIDFISNSFNMEVFFREVERLCKTVNLVIFCSNKQLSTIMKYWEEKRYSTTLLVWDKPNPIPFGNGKYISNLEFLIYVRGKGAIYNSIGYKEQLKTFRYSVPSTKGRLHPTEKPIELLERVIKVHSNENNSILDPFMGSGTTGVAAKELGRNFIGMEVLPKYFDIAKRRIENAQVDIFAGGYKL